MQHTDDKWPYNECRPMIMLMAIIMMAKNDEKNRNKKCEWKVEAGVDNTVMR